MYRDAALRQQDNNHATERAGPNQCTKLSISEVYACRDKWNMKVLQNSVSKLTSEQQSFLDDALSKCAGHIAIAYVLWESGLPCQCISEEGVRNNADITRPATIQNYLDNMIKFFGTVAIQLQKQDVKTTPDNIRALQSAGRLQSDQSSTERPRATEHGSSKASTNETMGPRTKPRVVLRAALTDHWKRSRADESETYQHGHKRRCLPQFSIAKTW